MHPFDEMYLFNDSAVSLVVAVMWLTNVKIVRGRRKATNGTLVDGGVPKLALMSLEYHLFFFIFFESVRVGI